MPKTRNVPLDKLSEPAPSIIELASARLPPPMLRSPEFAAATSRSENRLAPSFVSVKPLRFSSPEKGGGVELGTALFNPIAEVSAEILASAANVTANPLTDPLVELLVIAPWLLKPLPAITIGLPVAVWPTPKKSSVAPLFTYIGEFIEPSVGLSAGEEKFGSNSFQTPLLTLIGPVKRLL